MNNPENARCNFQIPKPNNREYYDSITFLIKIMHSITTNPYSNRKSIRNSLQRTNNRTYGQKHLR
jgi:hypothetical protein